MKNFKISKEDSKGNGGFAIWLKVGLIVGVTGILMAVCVASYLRFNSPSTIINAMAMNPDYTEMSYNELDRKLTVIGKDNKKAKFRFHEENWEYLQSRLIEKNKDWGGWTFEHKEMPAGEGDEKYKVYHGAREPK